MNAIILSVGDELVLGQTVDTNSAWLSQQLAAVGCEVVAHVNGPRQRDAIAVAIREMWAGAISSAHLRRYRPDRGRPDSPGAGQRDAASAGAELDVARKAR